MKKIAVLLVVMASVFSSVDGQQAVPKYRYAWDKVVTASNNLMLAQGSTDGMSEKEQAEVIVSLLRKGFKSVRYSYSETLEKYAGDEIPAHLFQYVMLLTFPYDLAHEDLLLEEVMGSKRDADNIRKLVEEVVAYR